ncbi:MAG: hydrogenase maturation nickel metallochaperone HypA [Alphaproteobacteria bacterium]|nr:hydrogenase maturation nickel metallochaperone HypA [Alphaproteobacteria bacterium]MCK5518360.1 hydrogenase maturation nickel metallochaperone HypA [Alphaproteobacteria bacterium]MCK5556041.1 hydrogenase maturation nickel metallochaperone HypA [Alphaproteobacteria bacterium]
MHEFSLMKDLLEKIEKIASDSGSNKVVSVKVKLGAMSDITPEHFSEHFDEAVLGTVAEGARLDVEQMTDVSSPTAQDILLDSVEVAG